jgi:hypothetical protein
MCDEIAIAFAILLDLAVRKPFPLPCKPTFLTFSPGGSTVFAVSLLPIDCCIKK